MGVVLRTFGKVLKATGKGTLKLGEMTAEKIAKDAPKVFDDVVNASEKVADSFIKEDGLGHKTFNKFFEKIPEAEKFGIEDEILPFRMKRYKTKLKKGKHGRTVLNDTELKPGINGLYNSSVWLKDNFIKSPGGRLALGITTLSAVDGFAVKGGNKNTTNIVEASVPANMLSKETSPLIKDNKALENLETRSAGTVGVEPDIVFALHNLR